MPRPRSVAPVRVTRLVDTSGAGGLRLLPIDADVAGTAVTGVTAASDRVQPGDLFAALPGRSGHGARYAPAAVAAGAAAVLTDEAGRDAVPAGTPVLIAPQVRDALGPVAAAVYGNPSRDLTVVGVTGTSGKTTTTFLLRAALAADGRVPGLIGTVATMLGDDQIKTGFTTPEAPELQALLALMRERGVSDVAMEVSSHALAMGRVAGTRFASAGFTNLSEDHLDFHATMDDYFEAKASLFQPHYTDRPVVVTDDVWGRRLAQRLPACVTVETTGGQSGTGGWQAFDVVDQPGGTTAFRVRGPREGATPLDRADAGSRGTEATAQPPVLMGCAIPGRYNVANATLALALACAIGVDRQVAAAAISTATVPGRMERVEAGQPFLAVVDYSHKPAAVDGALRALRPLTRGRLIVVLGCGGDRDRGKRPHMGEIAARGADLLIVTDDNPRSEDPAAIRRAMLDGARHVPPGERGDVREVGDRREAIAAAVAQAQDGDTVLVAGKGHETGQEIAGITHPFDDRTVLRAALLEVPAP